MSTTTKVERVPRIRELLGPAVLLRWPLGTKGGQRKWKELRLADMTDAYLAKLETNCNIGVALGKVSGGLVTIDFDQDEPADCFLKANPFLTDTLRTRARRGCNIWLRCSGDYPATRKLKNPSGEEIGEWRSDGSQTIISGMHPDGMAYHFIIEQPVVEVSYGAIIWPTELVSAPDATESKRVRGVGEKEVVVAGACAGEPVVLNSECREIKAFLARNDVVARVAPTKEHQNNSSLFALAGWVKRYENEIGRSATETELDFVFDQWCQPSQKFWRPELVRDDYDAEFRMAYSYRRHGFNENPLEVAIARAKAAPLPEIAGRKSKTARLIAAICRELQNLMGASPWFLPTRSLYERMGVHWTTVANCLRWFDCKKIIRLAPGEVRRRGSKRSPRYFYCEHPTT